MKKSIVIFMLLLVTVSMVAGPSLENQLVNMAKQDLRASGCFDTVTGKLDGFVTKQLVNDGGMMVDGYAVTIYKPVKCPPGAICILGFIQIGKVYYTADFKMVGMECSALAAA